MSRNDFGKIVMQWGTGFHEAVIRMETISLHWLHKHQVTQAMMQQWQQFYEDTFVRNPNNDSAEGRAILTRYCAGLFASEVSE